MLQPINANALASPGNSTTQTLPSGFAQARSAEGEARPFELQMAVQGFAAGNAQAPSSESATPVTVPLSEADAEQWLAGVLNQQAVRIEAREAPQPAQQQRAEQDDSEGEQVPALPGEPVSQAQPQLRQPAPAEPARAANAPVLSQPTAPLPAQVAPATPQVAPEVAIQTASPVLANESAELKVLERLPGSSSDGDKPAAAPAAAAPTTAPLAVERPLKLHAPQAQWGEQMLASLREHVDVQINQRIQNATIRLDPPELGSLEIFLSHESGRLSVQLSAANADVARLLQQTSERLRQELVGQNFVQVNVQVSADAQGGRQQQQAQAHAWLGEDAVAAAAALPAGSERDAAQSASDVLVTV